MLGNDIRNQLRKLGSTQALLKLLKSSDLSELSQRDVDSISRAHRRLIGNPDCKIAYLSNHTIEPLDRFVEVTCLLQGTTVASYIGDYDQHFQEILNEKSDLHSFQPDIVFLDLSLRKLSPRLYYELLSLNYQQRQEELDRVMQLIKDWVESAETRSDATLIISNFSRPAGVQAGIADIKLRLGEAELYSALNMKLHQLCADDARINILDMDHVLSCVGKSHAHDPRMYYLAKMEWTESALQSISSELTRYVSAILGKAKKCLVLDLDNTLWGGIVGEDGVDGILIGDGSPEGEAFLDFQRYIRGLKGRGVILAICSKNNLDDVETVFEKREDMLLSLDEFAALKINWERKHLNLQSIANELNIGTDSMVFVDDNPAECELVRQLMPEVETVELSGDPSTYISKLQKIPSFEKIEITDEDRQKAQLYKENKMRDTLRQDIVDIDTYLESLGTEIEIYSPDNKHKSRIHQLFSKTNQFNLTTCRYSLGDIQQFIDDSAWDISIAHVKDNFGDLGIVGLYLINRKGDAANIDSFILSCRAMGRGIETAMMNKIKEDYLLSECFDKINSVFVPTQKNKPAAEFYESEGFSLVSEESSGRKSYIVTKSDVKLRECPGITLRRS